MHNFGQIGEEKLAFFAAFLINLKQLGKSDHKHSICQ